MCWSVTLELRRVVADVAETYVLWNNTHDSYRGMLNHAWPVSSGRGQAVTLATPTTAAALPYSSLASCCSTPDDGLNVGQQNRLTTAGQKRSCSIVSPDVARRCRIIAPLEFPTDPDVIMHSGNRGDGAA
jgi:hypothetical protein